MNFFLRRRATVLATSGVTAVEEWADLAVRASLS
ncbi:MAG: hypothetical protein JWN97_3483 [Nocardioides sp.]|nr:hypothetical protein [Nocardioides sp.]